MEQQERAKEIARRHVESLNEDNAFIDVGETLHRKRARGQGAATGRSAQDDDDDDAFLGNLRITSRWASEREGGGARSGSKIPPPHALALAASSAATVVVHQGHSNSAAFPKRLNIAKVLADQHKSYLDALADAAEGGDEKTTGVSSTSTGVKHTTVTQKALRSATKANAARHSESILCSSVDDADMLLLGRDPVLDELHTPLERAVDAQSRLLELWMSSHRHKAATTAGLERDAGATVKVQPSYLSQVQVPLQRREAATAGSRLCSVCLIPAAPYTCEKCRKARFCSIDCFDIHEDTRCMKFVV